MFAFQCYILQIILQFFCKESIAFFLIEFFCNLYTTIKLLPKIWKKEHFKVLIYLANIEGHLSSLWDRCILSTNLLKNNIKIFCLIIIT